MQTHNHLKVTSCIRMTSNEKAFNKGNIFYFILSKCGPSIRCAQRCVGFEARLSGHPCCITSIGEIKIHKKKLAELPERGRFFEAQMRL
jgi:hypothetical protein